MGARVMGRGRRWSALFVAALAVLAVVLVGATFAAPAGADSVCLPLVPDVSVYAGQQVTLSAGSPCPSLTGPTTVQWESAPSDSSAFSPIVGADSETLTFTAAGAESGELLEPVFTSASGSAVGQEYGVDVLALPTVASQTVTAGDTATLTMQGDLGIASAVQWQESTDGGVTWSDDTTDAGATTDTLTVADTSFSEDGEQFRVQITDSYGSVDTAPATLTVTSIGGSVPVITSQPTSQTVMCIDTPATFTVAGTGIPTPTVQWQVLTAGSVTWTDDTTDAGNTTDTLTVSDPMVALSGNQYRAVLTNAQGSVTSNGAVLTVDAGPPITTEPLSTSVAAGGSASFTAAAPCYALGTVQWQVSTDGGATWANDTTDAGAATDTLTVSPVTSSENGDQYRALFSYSTSTVTTSAATLTVGAPPVITEQPGSANPCLGLTVTLTAAASGTPSPTVQWQVSTDGGSTWTDDTTDTGATTDSLTLVGSQNTDSREYRAVFTNVFGSTASSAAEIFVDYPPPVSALPSNPQVLAGQSVTLSVAYGGSCYTALPVQWQVSPSGSTAFTDIAGATSTTLTIPDTTVSESGNRYQPQVGSATTGVLVYPATLTVLAVPAPASQTVAPGATATFSAAPGGAALPGGWSIQWQVSTDGGATWSNDSADGGATTETLSVAGVTAAQSGDQFRAAITDPAGTVDTPPATLTVKASNAPVVSGVSPNSGGPFSIVLISGTNLSHATAVSFGSGHRAFFLALSSRLVIALAPPHAAGAVAVTVTTRVGTSATSSADQFTYR